MTLKIISAEQIEFEGTVEQVTLHDELRGWWQHRGA